MKVFAYELPFRTSPENRAAPNSIASQIVIVDSLVAFDLERLIGPAKAFVNADDRTLLSEAALPECSTRATEKASMLV